MPLLVFLAEAMRDSDTEGIDFGLQIKFTDVEADKTSFIHLARGNTRLERILNREKVEDVAEHPLGHGANLPLLGKDCLYHLTCWLRFFFPNLLLIAN